MNPVQNLRVETVVSLTPIHALEKKWKQQDERFREYLDPSFTRRLIEHFHRAKIAALREKE